MGTKLAIGAGLAAGILVGGLVVGGALAMLPPPPAPPVPTSSPIAVITPSPDPSRAPSPTPPPTATATATATPAATPPPSPASTSGFAIGHLAPELKLPMAGGGTIDLAALRGKPVWVMFMATWCPECRAELPVVATLQARYANTGLTVILVDVKEPATDVAGQLASLGVSLPVGLDDTGSVAANWGADALPAHFWLSADGVVAAGAVGSVGADQMAAGLSKILPGVTVTP